MKKALILVLILALAALMMFGCTKQSQYPTGAAAYGGQQPQGGYVGGGCGVAPVSNGDLPVSISEATSAA